MGANVKVVGMVLSAMPIGEYDKRVTILTKERGKIAAFARGARRPGNQFLAVANPFVFGEFELFEGRNSYTISKASIKNYFRDLAADIESASLGFYFTEFSDYFCQENNDEREMLKLLYQSMRALENPRLPKKLVRFVFELRAVSINGIGPDVFTCKSCRSKEDLCFFSVEAGGVFCKNCGNNLTGKPISPSALYAMQFVIATPIEKLYTFIVTDEVLYELTSIMDEYLKRYVRHTFNSLEIFG